MITDRSTLTTEKRNARSAAIDRADTLGIVDIITAEDALIVPAIVAQREALAAAVDMVVARLRKGGRLFYVGAGTSGRLGVLDASECPPTYGTKPTMVQGIIAGGHRALVRSVEGAEDDSQAAANQLAKKRLNSHDVVCGIAASGVTPFVHGAMALAKQVGAGRLFVTCSPEARSIIDADIIINPVVGPEVVTGSTRMKAGTATKLVLNTLTTATMIRLGKVYGNLMVDVRATNAKLRDRAQRIVTSATGVDGPTAASLLASAAGHAKTAILMHLAGVDAQAARALLKKTAGQLREAMELVGKTIR